MPERTLLELVDDTNSPIKFDQVVGEYGLVYDTFREGERCRMSYPLRYSPFTGAPLPSKRSELFMTTSPDEVRMITEKLKDARSYADVEKALGAPDVTLSGAVYSFTANRKAHYTYTNAAATLNVGVWEYEDGRIEYGCSGKRKSR